MPGLTETGRAEIYIIPSTGPTAKDPARNVTRYALFNAGITWSKNGKLAFLSERRSGAPSSMYVMSLQRPAVAAAPVSSAIDWDDIHLRVSSRRPPRHGRSHFAGWFAYCLPLPAERR